MTAPIPGTISRYTVYVGGAAYIGANIQDVKVTTKKNQIGIGEVELNLTSSVLISDGGTELTLDQVNNLHIYGLVSLEDEVVRYLSRTSLTPLIKLDAEYEAYCSDPDSYVPLGPTPFQLTNLTRGYLSTPSWHHSPGTRVSIYPTPAEGMGIEIYLGLRCILTGTVSHVERDENNNSIRIECEGIEGKIRNIPVSTKTLYLETRTGSILATLQPDDDPPDHYWDSDIDLGLVMNYRMELGNNLMHLANLSLLSSMDWWVSTLDDYHTIHCRADRGSAVPLATWTAKLTALNLIRSFSKEKIYNSITAVGSSQELQGASTTIEANTGRIARLASTESTLAENINATATSVTLVNAASYSIGDTIQIGSEKIAILAKEGNVLSTITRHTEGTTAAAHHVGDPALMITSLDVDDMNLLTYDDYDPTTVYIGSEKIAVGGIYGNKLQNLTRGVDSTTAYAHRAGTLVICADFTNEAPEEGSSIALYGLRGMRQSAIGAADLDGLDKYAGALLLGLKDLLEGGTFQVPLSAFPDGMDIGDTFTLQEYGISGSANHRIAGLTWDMSGTVTVEYGHPEEWILADFEDAAKAMQLATQRSAPAAQAPVIQVSEDGKMVQIQSPDGLIWVRVKQ